MAQQARSTPKVAPARPRTVRVASMPMPAALLDATIEPDVVEVPARTAVAIDGEGPPDSEAFGRPIRAIYGAAYGLKFSRKASGPTFTIGPLEGRWWAMLREVLAGSRAPRRAAERARASRGRVARSPGA